MSKQEPELDQISLVPLEEAEVQLLTLPLDHLPSDDELDGPAPSRQFVADVKKRGVIYPICAIRTPEGYDVRDGRNRIKTARILKHDAIRALVFSNIGTYEALTITTAANAHRRSNPISDLVVLRRLAREGKPTSLSGLPASTIKRLERLSQLEPEFLEAIHEGQMSVATANVLVTVEPGRRKALIGTAKDGKKITSADVQGLKRVQVADTAGEFDNLLNAPMVSEVERFVVANPGTESIGSYGTSLDVARTLAKAKGEGFKVYRLVEVG
jgi:ParB-like chromosome segregation protein Spo0J